MRISLAGYKQVALRNDDLSQMRRGKNQVSDVHFTAKQIFPNYTSARKLVPESIWVLLRLISLGTCLALVALLALQPQQTLPIFWGLIVPLLPAMLIITPGFWRQVCPFAYANQIPRLAGFSRNLTLPRFVADYAYAIAIALFVACVVMRKPLFNNSGIAIASAIALMLVAAFAGGVIFKGRSGWCGTICPLGPIQRNYGQAPLLTVTNGFCPTCVGCQKNCYDFNPKAAVFDDIYDEDTGYAGQRQFFMGLLPGLIVGYFLFSPLDLPPLHYSAFLFATTFFSAALHTFLGLDAHRSSLIYAAAAIVMFYFFAGPGIARTLDELIGRQVDRHDVVFFQAIGAVLGAALVASGWKNGKLYNSARKKAMIEEKWAHDTSGQVHEVCDETTGKIFAIGTGRTLLSAIQGNALTINAGCCSGLCGSDPVLILEGMENLSPPTEDEKKTLMRLNLDPRTRLACCCQVEGPVKISRDPKKPSELQIVSPKRKRGSNPLERRIQLALRKTPERPAMIALGAPTDVVVVGNGIAATSAAEALRAGNARCRITLVSNEPYPFYNRMAIGKIINGQKSPQDLMLSPLDWDQEKNIALKLNARAVSIDRTGRQVMMMNGDVLHYDHLILATGARSAVPAPNFRTHLNAFVLRDIHNAQEIRDYAKSHHSKSAIVIGGGVLGVEAAEVLCDIGLQTTIVHRGSHLMERQLDTEGARILRRYLEKRGIAVRTDATVSAYEGEGLYSRILMQDGSRLEADIFVASIGIVPNVELARDCGLEIGRGIPVDDSMRTSDRHIFAIGDAAEHNGRTPGLWNVAIAQAHTAAASILGKAAVCVGSKEIIALKSEGIELFSFGDPAHSPEGCEVLESPMFSANWWRIHICNGRIEMAIFAGPKGSATHFMRLIKSQLPVEDYLPQLREGDLSVLRKVRMV
jgi:nitrite reductase (NADH) large subunit